MNARLSEYTTQLVNIFKNPDRYAAHREAQPILIEMTKNPEIWFEIITENLLKHGFFSQKRINPVIRFDILENEQLSLVAHAWFPLPDRNTNITHQSIHHHGKLLLSTASAYGIGYDSILFQQGFTINKDTQQATLKVAKAYHNALNTVEFIDVDTPHVVFYPKEFSVTYALWTTHAPAKTDKLKQLGWVQYFKKPLKKLIKALGLSKSLGVNVVEYLDFAIENNKIIALKDRLMYPEGTQINHIQNVFALLQWVNYPYIDVLQKMPLTAEERVLVQPFIDKLIAKEPIQDSFEPSHLNIARVNLPRTELYQYFGL